MNQFANIGSMFPGAQNKAIRDKLKQLLTMPGNRQVTGLVLTDEKKDTMIVNGESATVTFFRLDPHGPKTLEAKWLDPKCWNGCQSLVFKHEAERVLGIAQAEFAYWKNVCDEDPGGYGIEGMAAAANIVAAITMGTSVEDFKAGKADYDRVTEPVVPNERDALALAGHLYGEYCKSVGGKAHDGQPLPDWQEFCKDEAKKKQSHGWLAAAQRAIDILQRPESPQAAKTWMKAFALFRQELRQALFERGYLTNPGSDDSELIEMVRSMRKIPADLHEKFAAMLVAEIKRHGGLPSLSEEETAFREAMAAFLEGGAK